MSRGEKVVALLLILLLAVCGWLLYRQSELKREQEKLDRKIERNPFFEPATNSDKTTTPGKP